MASDLALRRMDEDAARRRELELAEQVHRLRVSGKSYLDIARQMGFSFDRASDLHNKHIERLRRLDELGGTQVSQRLMDERYEALLSVLWRDAMNGDVVAIRECRQLLDSISQRTDKITALFTRTNTGEESVTLVASGSTEEYIEALKRLNT